MGDGFLDMSPCQFDDRLHLEKNDEKPNQNHQ